MNARRCLAACLSETSSPEASAIPGIGLYPFGHNQRRVSPLSLTTEGFTRCPITTEAERRCPYSKPVGGNVQDFPMSERSASVLTFESKLVPRQGWCLRLAQCLQTCIIFFSVPVCVACLGCLACFACVVQRHDSCPGGRMSLECVRQRSPWGCLTTPAGWWCCVRKLSN